MAYSTILQAVKTAIVAISDSTLDVDSIVIESPPVSFLTRIVNDWPAANIRFVSSTPSAYETGGHIIKAIRVEIDLAVMPKAEGLDFYNGADGLLREAWAIEQALTDNVLAGNVIGAKIIETVETEDFAPAHGVRIAVELYERQQFA